MDAEGGEEADVRSGDVGRGAAGEAPGYRDQRGPGSGGPAGGWDLGGGGAEVGVQGAGGGAQRLRL